MLPAVRHPMLNTSGARHPCNWKEECHMSAQEAPCPARNRNRSNLCRRCRPLQNCTPSFPPGASNISNPWQAKNKKKESASGLSRECASLSALRAQICPPFRRLDVRGFGEGTMFLTDPGSIPFDASRQNWQHPNFLVPLGQLSASMFRKGTCEIW
jgi:hypothetical protein